MRRWCGACGNSLCSPATRPSSHRRGQVDFTGADFVLTSPALLRPAAAAPAGPAADRECARLLAALDSAIGGVLDLLAD